MAKKPLSESFSPKEYVLSLQKYPQIEIKIIGRKTGRPAKRLTFHQKGIRLESAQITGKRRNISYSYRVSRINHLSTQQEVRIHTQETIYPGEYKLNLIFTAKQPLEAYRQIEAKETWRAYFPSIDEPESRAAAEFTLS